MTTGGEKSSRVTFFPRKQSAMAAPVFLLALRQYKVLTSARIKEMFTSKI